MATDNTGSKPIGIIKSVTGDARVFAADGTIRPAAVGDKLFAREMVFTTANASVQVQLDNGQLINVEPDSEYFVSADGSGGTPGVAEQGAQSGAVAGGAPGAGEPLGGKVIGTIKDIVGDAKVVAPDGSVRTAQVGDKVYAGEVVNSSAQGQVNIALEGGGSVECGPGANLMLAPGILSLAQGEKQPTDIAAIQAAIAAGADPTAVADATAAGGAPAAGGSEDGGGGHGFVLLQQANTQGVVGAGFTTSGAGIGFPNIDYQLLALLQQTPTVSLLPTGPTVVEGTNGAEGKIVTFVVQLDHAFQADVQVSYVVTPPPADSNGLDLVGPFTGTVTILSGATEATIQIEVVQDHFVEGNEPVTIQLTGAVNANINPEADSTTITIIDDDLPPIANDDTFTFAEGHVPGETPDGNVLPNDTAQGPEDLVVITAGTFQTSAGGTVVLQSNGDFAYTPPDENFNGSDSFEYTIQEFHNGELINSTDGATVSITVTPVNDPPVITPVQVEGSVFEAGLPTADRPANGEQLKTGGSFTVSDIDGDTITLAEVQYRPSGMDQYFVVALDPGTSSTTIDTGHGILTLNSTNGGQNWTWSYELYAPVADGAGTEQDAFRVTVTDGTDTSSTEIVATVVINDDVPLAVNDTATIAEDTASAINGDVLANDLSGADAPKSLLAWGNETGQYGTVTKNANGTWSYQLDNSLNAVQGLSEGETLIETFSYTMRDADGDPSPATLKITITGSDDGVPIFGIGSSAGDETVYEKNLSDGSAPDAAALTQSGSFTIDAKDGIAVVQVGDDVTGVTLSVTQLLNAATYPVSVDTDAGVLVLTGYAGDEFGGTVSYSYTLQDNLPHASGSGANSAFDNFAVSVTDEDGSTSTSTIIINIVDDLPAAADDATPMLVEDGLSAVSGNVLDNDTANADPDKAFVGWDDAANAAGVATLGQYGTLVLNPTTGAYSFALDNSRPAVQALTSDDHLEFSFAYAMRDADGDEKSATLTISVHGADDGASVKTANSEGPDATVYERGLTSSSDTSESTSGTTFSVAATDGIKNVVIGGVSFTLAEMQSFDGSQTVSTGEGTLTLTGYAGNSFGGTVSYTYTLNATIDNDSKVAVAPDAVTPEHFDDHVTITVNGIGGTSSSDSLVVRAVDDTPSAENDSDSIAAGAYGPVTGNVITDAAAGDAGDSDTGADTVGADGAEVSGVVSVNVSENQAAEVGGVFTIAGQYGVLTIEADGDYSYLRDPNTKGGVTDTFTYTLTDGDGDSVTANLAISVGDSGTTLIVPSGDGEGTHVSEAGLPARGLEAAGSDSASDSETTSGTIKFNAEDGAPVVTIDGTAVTGSVGQQFEHAGVGTLTITGYSYDPVSGDGSIGYSYTLADNTSGDATHDDFALVVTDQDGDSSSSKLVINIADDAPIANPDTDSVTEGSGNVATGNVVLGGIDAGDPNSTDGVADVAGADSFNGAVVGVAAGNTGATLVDGTTIGTAVTGAYGVLTLNADGSYSYNPSENIDSATPVPDVFTYTIRDGDGDLRSTTLTISVSDGAGPQAQATPLSLSVDDQNLASGSTPAGSDSDAGTMTFTAGSDALVSFAFGEDLSALDTSLTWSRESSTLIRGSDERGAVIELSLTGPESGSIGVEQSGTVKVTATLLQNYDTHPAFTADDLKALGSVAVVASDHDGDSTSQLVTVSVSDDVPVLEILPVVADDDPTVDVVLENAAAITGTWTHDYRADADTNGDADGPATIKVLVDGMQGEFNLDEPITVAGKGTLTVASDGTWSFAPVISVISTQEVNFTLRITDSDGDVASDSHTVRIVDANSPLGVANIANPVDEEGLAGIAGGVNDDPGENATVGGTLTFSYGNDGANGATPFVWNTLGLPTVVTSANESLVSYAVVNGTTVVGFTAAGSAAQPDVFKLTLDPATKAYTFQLFQPLEHPAGDDENNIDFTFGYTIMDADGSTDKGSLAVTVDDDTPTIVGTQATVLLDDEAATTVYATANAGGTDDQSPDKVATTGTLLHNYGADGAGTVLLTGATLPSSGGFSSSLSTDGLTLTIKQVQNSITVDVMTVKLDDATGGSYTVTQLKPIFHPTAGESEENLDFTIAYQVTDGDGDTVNGSLAISVDDDTPIANGATDVITFNADDFLVDGNLNVSIGADGLGSYQFSGFANGDQGKVGLLNEKDMTSDGAPVYLFGVGTNVLTGTTNIENSDAAARVFTVTLNSDGTYTLEMMGSLDSLTDFNLIDLGTLGISGGNGAYFVVGSGTTGTSGDDVLITAAQPNGTVNTASDDIGTGNQWVVERTGLRFDFVNNVQSNGTFSDHRTLTGVTVGLADVSPTGGGDSETDVIIGLFKGSTNTLPSGINIFAGLAASSAGTITDLEQADIDIFKSLVTSIRYFTNGNGVGAPVEVVLKTPEEIQQAFDDGRIELVQGYDTTYQQGKVTLPDSISGLVVHDVYANTSVGLTTTVGFDAVEIFNYDGFKFSINSISGAYLSTEKVVFNADFVAIDGDDDKAPDSFTMTVNPVVEGDENANVLNGGNSDDLIKGFGGHDILNGNAGNDILIGGPGNDTLTGGAGHDTFKYDTQSEGTDQIMDFNTDSPVTPNGSGDVLDISAVLDLGGTWAGGSLSEAVESGYVSFTNNGGKVQVNVDMDGGSNNLVPIAVLQSVAFPPSDPTNTLITLLGDNIKLD